MDPRILPKFDKEKLASFPEGYRYLAYGQSSAYKVRLLRIIMLFVYAPFLTPGVQIKIDLPQSHGQAHDDFYQSFIDVSPPKLFLGSLKPCLRYYHSAVARRRDH